MSATEIRSDSVDEQATKASAAELELSKDDIFHLLQTPRRRDVLRYLKDHEGPVEMRDVAEQVAAWENDTTVEALTSDERQRVYIPLYQSHLPKLDEEGVIDYDQNRGTVQRTNLANKLDRYLDISDDEDADEAVEDEIPWETYYLGVSVLGTLLLGGSQFGLPVLGFLPAVAVGGLVVCMFVLVTCAQLFVDRH